MKRRMAIGMFLCLTPCAFAGFNATAAGPINADGGYGSPLNGSFTYDYAGGNFLLQDIAFSGTVTSVNSATLLEELGIKITDPTGSSISYDNFIPNGDTDFTTEHITKTFNSAGLTGTPGTYTFTFYDTFDDDGVDAEWTNLSFAFQNANRFLSDYSIDTLQPGETITGSNNTGMDFLNRGQGWGENGRNDVVYAVEWTGGDFGAFIEFEQANDDLDFFLWGDNMATNLLDSSLDSTDLPIDPDDDPLMEYENLYYPNLAAGTYYMHVEGGWVGDINNFTLRVHTPEPGSLALLVIGGLAIVRRRK